MSQTIARSARRPATYDDLLAVPEHLVAEILFGALVTHPRPAPPARGGRQVRSVTYSDRPFSLETVGRAVGSSW